MAHAAWAGYYQPLAPRPTSAIPWGAIGLMALVAACLLLLPLSLSAGSDHHAVALPGRTVGRPWRPASQVLPKQVAAPYLSQPILPRAPFMRFATEAGGIAGEDEHKVASMPKLTEEQLQMRQALQQHQKEAARLSNAEEARNLMEYGTGYGVIGTNSVHQPGYPAGSIVLFATDAKGRPVFSFSAMSTHTQDLQKDPKASFVVAAENFKGIEDGRVTFVGDIHPVPAGEVPELKAIYKKRHPSAFWVDLLGDLSWWRMDAIQSIRFVWGFANAGSIKPAEYEGVQPDPIAAFAKPVISHMNQDHGDANRAMVNHYLPIKVDSADIVGLDRLGMYVQVSKEGASFKVRLPFIREATDRKAVKEILVEMTKAGAAAPAENN